MRESAWLVLIVSCLAITPGSLQAQSSPPKGPLPPAVWGPHVPGADPPDTSKCVKECNAEFEKELKKCFALEGTARTDCEQPARESHRSCFTGCPK